MKTLQYQKFTISTAFQVQLWTIRIILKQHKYFLEDVQDKRRSAIADIAKSV